MTLVELEQLALVPPTATVDQIAEALNALDAFRTRLAEARKVLEGCLVEWIEANGRDIEIGTVRYYVGTDKVWSCTDRAGAVDLAMRLSEIVDASTGEVVGIDREQLAMLIASDPIKRGAATKLAEERGINVKGIWTCTERESLKDGKPTQKLQHVDTQFIR